MPWDPRWDHVRSALSIAANERWTPTKYEPGDIAFAHGNIATSFYKYLWNQGYRLWSDEMDAFNNEQTPRYCIVLDRLPNDEGPIGRYFGVPLGETKWPHIPGIKINPFWTTQSFAFGVPSRCNHLQKSNLKAHFRLAPGELARLRTLIAFRMQALSDYLPRIRSENVAWYTSIRRQRREGWEGFMRATREEPRAAVIRKPDLLPLHFHRPTRSQSRLETPIPNHGRWLMKHLKEDIMNQSTYLNSSGSAQMRSTGSTVIPSPYYAPCLRTSLTTITRLIHP